MRIKGFFWILAVILVGLPSVWGAVDWVNQRYPTETASNSNNFHNMVCNSGSNATPTDYFHCNISTLPNPAPYGHWDKQLPKVFNNTGNVTLEFNLRTNVACVSGYNSIYIMNQNSSAGALTGQTWALNKLANGSINLREQTVGTTGAATGMFADGTWHRVRLVFYENYPTQSIAVYINGTFNQNMSLNTNVTTSFFVQFGYLDSLCDFDVDNMTAYNQSAPDIFNFVATDYIDNTTLTNFKLIINNQSMNSTYDSSNGTLNISTLPNSIAQFPYGRYNISLSSNQSGGYFNRTFDNFLISTNAFSLNLWQALLYVNASEFIFGTSIPNLGAKFNSSQLINISNSSGFATLILRAGDFNITVNSTPYQNNTVTITLSALEERILTVNLSSILLKINTTIVTTGLGISNFNINTLRNSSDYSDNRTTTNGVIYVPLVNGSYLFQFTSSSAGSQNATFSVNTTSYYPNYTFLIYTINSVNFSIFDEFLGKPNKILSNVTLELVSNTFSQNYTTTNGSLYLDLNPESYRISYSAGNYRKRSYYFSLNNGSHADIDLYLLSVGNGTLTTFSFVDELSDPAVNQTVQALRYYISNNGYLVVAMAVTDSLGQVQFDLEHYTPFYRFLVLDEDSNMVYLSSGNVIYQTSYEDIRIGTSSDTFGSIQKGTLVYRNLSYSNVSNTVSFTFSDSTGLAAQACLIADSVNFGGSTNICHNCVTATASTILCDVNQSLYVNNTVIARAFVYETANNNNTATPLDILIISPSNMIERAKDTFGTYGVFVTGIFILGMVLLAASGGIAAAIIIGLVGLVVTYLLGTYTMGVQQVTWIVGLVILGGIIIFKARSS